MALVSSQFSEVSFRKWWIAPPICSDDDIGDVISFCHAYFYSRAREPWNQRTIIEASGRKTCRSRVLIQGCGSSGSIDTYSGGSMISQRGAPRWKNLNREGCASPWICPWPKIWKLIGPEVRIQGAGSSGSLRPTVADPWFSRGMPQGVPTYIVL